MTLLLIFGLLVIAWIVCWMTLNWTTREKIIDTTLLLAKGVLLAAVAVGIIGLWGVMAP